MKTTKKLVELVFLAALALGNAGHGNMMPPYARKPFTPPSINHKETVIYHAGKIGKEQVNLYERSSLFGSDLVLEIIKEDGTNVKYIDRIQNDKKDFKIDLVEKNGIPTKEVSPADQEKFDYYLDEVLSK